MPFDIIIFAMIAGFLIYRLHNILGQRGQLKQLSEDIASKINSKPDTQQHSELDEGLEQIKELDNSFNEQQFIAGAKAAFKIIVEAFAQGDTHTLQTLLNDELYNDFAHAIQERKNAGEIHEVTIHNFISVHICEAAIKTHLAYITVQFVTQQSHVLRDNHDRILDDKDQPQEITDIWMFMRDLYSRNPNWSLVETRTTD